MAPGHILNVPTLLVGCTTVERPFHSTTGKAVRKQEKDVWKQERPFANRKKNVQKHVAYTLNFTYTEKNTKSKCMQKVFCVNQHLKTTMRQLTPQKLRQMTCTKLKCVKNHPQKVRQLTWKKWSASKITPKKCVNWHGKNDLRQKSSCVTILCVKNHPASIFHASKAPRQRPRP